MRHCAPVVPGPPTAGAQSRRPQEAHTEAGSPRPRLRRPELQVTRNRALPTFLPAGSQSLRGRSLNPCPQWPPGTRRGPTMWMEVSELHPPPREWTTSRCREVSGWEVSSICAGHLGGFERRRGSDERLPTTPPIFQPRRSATSTRRPDTNHPSHIETMINAGVRTVTAARQGESRAGSSPAQFKDEPCV